jgi:hypothetical protein
MKKIFIIIKKNPIIFSFLKKIFNKSYDLQKDIKIVKNGNELVSYNSKELLLLTSKKMDFFIYSDYSECNEMSDEERINQVIYYEMPKSFDYICCNYRFISISIELEENKNYSIKLFTDKENYFVSGNIITKYIIYYLLKRQNDIDENIKIENFTYKMELFDNNANIVKLTEEEQIVLLVDNYFITPLSYYSHSNFDKKEEKDENEEEDENKQIERSEPYEFIS